MIRLQVIRMFSIVLPFAMSCFLVFAQVPGAQIGLDATKGASKNAWKNFGTAGGEFPAGPNGAPNLEAAAGKDPARYTGVAGKVFGMDPPTKQTPIIHLENWTVELHIKRNGDGFGGEHHIGGFRSFNPRHEQRIDMHFNGTKTGAINVDMKGLKSDRNTFKEVLDIEVNEWHRIAFVYNETAKTLEGYLDGKRIKKLTTKGLDYDHGQDMNFHSLFVSHVPEHGRSLNGSISLVRVYDKALTAEQILQNFEGRAVASPRDKLATTWGNVKVRY